MIRARELGEADIAIWRRLRHEGVRLYPGAFLPSLVEVERVTEAQDAAALARGGRFAVFRDEVPVGIAALRREMFERARHRASIGPFYVIREAWGSGAADRLMDVLDAAAEAAGIWQLELSVAADNPRARRFYERHGFAEVGQLPNVVLQDGAPQDDLFMVRILTQ